MFRIYKHKYQNKYAIAFRGTETSWDLVDTVSDWFTNVEVVPVPTHLCPPILNGDCAWFHSGYYLEYMSYRSELISIIQSALQSGTNPQLIVTGHSQGGGLAQLCAVDLALVFNISTSQMKLITFAAPAPGYSLFQYLGQRYVNHLRIVLGCYCKDLSCIYLDMVEGILTSNHFGQLFALRYEYDPWPLYTTLHSLKNYMDHVNMKTPLQEIIRMFVFNSIITSPYQQLLVQDSDWFRCSMQVSIFSVSNPQSNLIFFRTNFECILCSLYVYKC